MILQQHPHAELSAYIDGALDQAAKAVVDGHLVTCALCRTHITELRATSGLLRALPDPVPSRRLVPRLAGAPAWLAPLRTLMTLASGAAVFLFIASALVTNITFLAGSGAGTTTAQEASRDTALNAQPPKAVTAGGAPAAPTTTPATGFAVGPTASPAPAPEALRSTASSPSPSVARSDDRTRADQATAAPSGAPVAAAPQGEARTASSEPGRSPLLNPWPWLAVAIISGAIAIALQRRLRASR